ncbi:transposase family protein [Streptomyces sp. ME01-18a]|uniref:transposase family protein n=1 Tax=Streptomyces sp. ME01-18a TaxID=3028669 RepID=UPI0029A915C6|nr:transposase family protein [Streptomyces sp. ME01-18a]MDX3434427.1 transposase family protein [Streptomyces sp. ME01-18a]
MPTSLGQLGAAPSLSIDECPGLLTCLATVMDPRGPWGQLHPLAGVLAICAAAVLTGAISLLAISEWAADASQSVLARLGARRDPGAHPTRELGPQPAPTRNRPHLANTESPSAHRREDS